MGMARSVKAEADYEARGKRPRRVVGVRLSDEEIAAAEDLRKTPKETVAGVLRRLLTQAAKRSRQRT